MRSWLPRSSTGSHPKGTYTLHTFSLPPESGNNREVSFFQELR